MKTMQFKVTIDAPRERVWRRMLDPEDYGTWTAAFAEGSYYEGSWDKGACIRFLTPAGEGMTSTIVENRPFEYISIQHLGIVKDGIDDTESPASRTWTPGFENYTLVESDGTTELTVDVDVPAEYEDFMTRTWPVAFDRLKRICET